MLFAMNSKVFSAVGNRPIWAAKSAGQLELALFLPLSSALLTLLPPPPPPPADISGAAQEAAGWRRVRHTNPLAGCFSGAQSLFFIGASTVKRRHLTGLLCCPFQPACLPACPPVRLPLLCVALIWSSLHVGRKEGARACSGGLSEVSLPVHQLACGACELPPTACHDG